MATIDVPENIPSNKGYIFEGQKIYGEQPVTDPERVELLDITTDKVHVWHRHGHTVFSQEIKDGVPSLCYETSIQMLPCPNEKTGHCSDRFDPEHRKFFHHYCHGRPRFHDGKPTCRYSRMDKENLCWERFNGEHNKCYHHID